jgi:hypothetical protein
VGCEKAGIQRHVFFLIKGSELWESAELSWGKGSVGSICLCLKGRS